MPVAQVSRGRLFPIPPTARSRRRAAARAAVVRLLGTAAPRYWTAGTRVLRAARDHPLAAVLTFAGLPLIIPAHVLLRPALLLLLTGGLLTAWELHRHPDRAPRGWLTARRVALWTGSSTTLLGVLGAALPGPLPLWLTLAAVAALILARRPVELTGTAWWAHRRLVPALIAARVIPTPRADQPPPRLGYLGRPDVDEHGTAITVRLPPGVTWQAVQDHRPQLASALDVPAARLIVRHDPQHAENVVTLWLATIGASATPVPAPVGTATRTRALDPLRRGLDDQQRPVVLPLAEHNLLVAGLPGYGKTSAVRVELLHALLDPTAQVLLLDGKGSRRDYAAAVPLCDRFLSGSDDNAPADLPDLLTHGLNEVRRRNGLDEPAEGWPLLLLLLEELQDVRAAATPDDRDRIDTTLGRYVRLGRAVNARLIVSTQRPSTDDLPSGVRNLIDQRLVLACRNPEDAKLALGTTPHGLTLPSRPGRAILATPAGVAPITLDLLDDAAWTAGCERAAALRTPTAEPAPVPVVKETPRVWPPVATAALTVLADQTPRTATELWAALAGHPDRPGSPVKLGQQLRRDAETGAPVVLVTVGKGRGWTVGAGYRTPAPTHADGRNGPPRTETGPADGQTAATGADAVRAAA